MAIFGNAVTDPYRLGKAKMSVDPQALLTEQYQIIYTYSTTQEAENMKKSSPAQKTAPKRILSLRPRPPARSRALLYTYIYQTHMYNMYQVYVM